MVEKAAKTPAPDKETPLKSPLRVVLMIVGALLLLLLGAGGGFVASKLLAPPPDEFAGLLQPAPAPAKPDEHGAEEDCAPASAEHGEDAAHEGGKPPCGPRKKKVESKPEFVTSYYDFPGNFTANLKNSRHFIQVTIALATQYDEQVFENVKAHEPALRGAVITTLADCTDEDIVGIDAKGKIAARIRDAINAVLVDKTRFGGVEEVHFTSFVTQ